MTTMWAVALPFCKNALKLSKLSRNSWYSNPKSMFCNMVLCEWRRDFSVKDWFWVLWVTNKNSSDLFRPPATYCVSYKNFKPQNKQAIIKTSSNIASIAFPGYLLERYLNLRISRVLMEKYSLTRFELSRPTNLCIREKQWWWLMTTYSLLHPNLP